MSDTNARPNLLETYRLSDLPPYGKLFVGIFTALMLLVCLWAVWIFYESRGKIDEGTVPPYMRADSLATDTATINEDLSEDLAEIEADTEAVIAPIWDSATAGQDVPIDSAEVARIARLAVEEQQALLDQQVAEEESPFRHNLGLAHTHVNGQTLLYFAMGLVFLFTSVSPKLKRIVFWTFGVCIVLHTAGLTGQGTHWVWDDMLAVSGLALLILIAYMAFLIFVDLGKGPRTSK